LHIVPRRQRRGDWHRVSIFASSPIALGACRPVSNVSHTLDHATLDLQGLSKSESDEEILTDILAAFERRLASNPAREFAATLKQVHQIALLQRGDL